MKKVLIGIVFLLALNMYSAETNEYNGGFGKFVTGNGYALCPLDGWPINFLGDDRLKVVASFVPYPKISNVTWSLKNVPTQEEVNGKANVFSNRDILEKTTDSFTKAKSLQVDANTGSCTASSLQISNLKKDKVDESELSNYELKANLDSDIANSPQVKANTSQVATNKENIDKKADASTLADYELKSSFDADVTKSPQVSTNKQNIEALNNKVDVLPTKEYVDNKDSECLSSAKSYTDNVVNGYEKKADLPKDIANNSSVISNTNGVANNKKSIANNATAIEGKADKFSNRNILDNTTDSFTVELNQQIQNNTDAISGGTVGKQYVDDEDAKTLADAEGYTDSQVASKADKFPNRDVLTSTNTPFTKSVKAQINGNTAGVASANLMLTKKANKFSNRKVLEETEVPFTNSLYTDMQNSQKKLDDTNDLAWKHDPIIKENSQVASGNNKTQWQIRGYLNDVYDYMSKKDPDYPKPVF